MTNNLCVPSLEVKNTLVSNVLHLLQIMVLCRIKQQPDIFWKTNLSESTPHDKLLLRTKLGINKFISFQIIPFSANSQVKENENENVVR